jgi:hypothetical protein
MRCAAVARRRLRRDKAWERSTLDFDGADSLTRTDDLPLTRRLLYQLSYAGVGWNTALHTP